MNEPVKFPVFVVMRNGHIMPPGIHLHRANAEATAAREEGEVVPLVASPTAAQPSPERIQIVHGLQLLLDKFYRFHAGAMNRHEVSAFQICKNELSAFMESVKSGSLNQNDASPAAAQEQKPVLWWAGDYEMTRGAFYATQKDAVAWAETQQELVSIRPLLASPTPASGEGKEK